MAQKTALYQIHEKLGGKIVEFAGWYLPVQYKNGILHEHSVVRQKAGLFDVSHMGEIFISGNNAQNALQKLVTNDISTMQNGWCRYCLMLYENGGIVDDLLVYKIDDNKYFLVVNASNADKDYEWICKNLQEGATAVNLSSQISQLALQGPLSHKIMEKLCNINELPVKNYRFTTKMKVAGYDCLVSTTGYTGEAGYEIYTANQSVAPLYELIMLAGEEYGLEPIGLGARDTLRFECCMTLYGHELTAEYKANEVGVGFAVKKGLGFIGEEALEEDAKYCRIGLKLIDKGIAREHYNLLNEQGEVVGITTSGMICPTVGGAYAMARVNKNCDLSNGVFVEVRGKKLKAEIVQMPFYKRINA